MYFWSTTGFGARRVVYGRFWWERRVWNSFAYCKWMFDLFGCGRVRAECFWYLDVVLHEFSTWTTSMSQTKLHVLFLEAAACFCDEFCLFCKWMRRCKCILEMDIDSWRWIQCLNSPSWRRVVFKWEGHIVCVVPLPFYQKEQLDKQKLNTACCMTRAWQLTFLLVFPVWKRDQSACSEAVVLGLGLLHVKRPTRWRPTPASAN